MKKLCSFVAALVLALSLCTPAFAAAGHFADLPTSHWAYQAAEAAYAAGVMQGTSGDPAKGNARFSAGQTLTKAEFATILCRAFYGGELTAAQWSSSWKSAVSWEFNTDQWYSAAVMVAVNHHLFDGTAQGTGGLTQPIDRYDMAAMLYALLQDNGISLPTDAKLHAAQEGIGDWAEIPDAFQRPVSVAFQLGLLRGTNEQGDFVGEGRTSRAQAAVVYTRMAGLFKDSAVQQRPSTSDAYIAEVLRLVNLEREKAGLSPLTRDETLMDVAQLRATECVTYYSHTRPDGSSCFTALDELKASYYGAGENIAAGYPTPLSVVDGWMNSEGHRKNILNPNFRRIGVGYAFQVSDPNYYQYYWAQMFTD